ncbi:CoA pyrophosphatase [Heyndrickxia oleronia]|nr:CoA pyrophosphatase [Heyndrickxia oleronia]NYV65537.1 CoA pyrophosphatase [Bacillus sp. Gen3]OJH20533.1 coenzyme A pyrophosphatase [Bacillus obstructivus]MCM3453373.1 CoA pyrophosphatase [Heyndrickxia oleronia]MEC1376536.1 CoA pyrophosphatase [Heyndrickxia oleronia]QQZ06996.1 CoA pyrophosphatase [Heyndrickxia oleronia]
MLEKYLNRIPKIIGEINYSKYAVFLPIIKKKEEYHILFEVRAYHMRRQPGEVCFPGGRVDKTDRDSKMTALRETKEELGVDSGNIEQIFPLDYVVSPFGTIIYPYAGIIRDEVEIIPNPEEVAETFTVPLSFFMETDPEYYKVHFHAEPEKDFPFHSIYGGEKYKWQIRHMDELFYFYGSYTIWGLTANILKNFIEIINNESSDR